MSPSSLDALFAPASIALVGANDRPGSVGEVVAANLLAGGFRGRLMFVDRKARTIHGQPVAPDLSALPHAPDLAVIATPAPVIPALIAELGALGCRAAVVLSAGFEGNEPQGAALRQALLDAARPHGLRIVGPNCLGFLSPARGINASFARGAAPPGAVALVAQSGAVAAAALDWAPTHGLGFSHIITLGDSLDVDIADVLQALADDPDVAAILAYVESLADGGRFLQAARRAAAAKPVVLLKGGRSEAGARAAFSHTRALAGADAVYAAACQAAGVLQVDGLESLLDAGLAFAHGRPGRSTNLAILTNGGGAGVLAVDALEREGGTLAALSADTQMQLRAQLPASGACGNPVDILGDAGPGLYDEALTTLLAAPEVDGALVLNCATAVADSGEAADAVIAARRACGEAKPVFAAWLGEAHVAAGRRKLADAGIPAFATPEATARAFTLLDRARRLQVGLADASPEATPPADLAGARAVVAGALADGRAALEPDEIARLLQAYRIPFVATHVVRTSGEAARVATELGGQVVLKILSRDISHKSDAGGVALGLSGGLAVEQAAQAMLANISAARPQARLDGFTVQPMLVRSQAQEVLAGVTRDPTFGPVVVVGHGGVAVEALADRALGLPPLSRSRARDMIGRTRVSRLLAGYRNHPPADLDALCGLLAALGRLALDLPQIAELDLNPVLCDAAGVVVLDARVALQTPGEAPQGTSTAAPANAPSRKSSSARFASASG
jgi:acetyltransferase